jgi:hypothetical protein
MENINPLYLSIAVTILASIVIFGIRFTLSRAEKFFEKIEKHFEYTDKKITLLFIEQDSTDYALDKCLPSNGCGFMDHKKEKKKELKEKADYVSGRFS